MSERERIDADEADDTISLQPLLHSLWQYRRVMGISIGLIAGAAAVLLLIGYLIAPKQKIASLGFQLTFDGADRDEFPNGTKFSASEIVGTPVLEQVFQADNLAPYMSITEFKQSMFVLPSNGEVELLSFEYQSKLADSKLTSVDRSRLEEEFKKKRESMKSAQYSINFARTERVMSIPVETLNRVLQDTLSTWAKQAADRKGAIRYNIVIISRDALPKDILSSDVDPAIVADRLRAKAMRVLRVLSGIVGIPGALAIRTDDGHVTLGDVRATLDDLVRFNLEPLIVQLRGTSVHDPVSVQRYFEGRYLQAQLERDEAQRRLKGTQDGLRTYLQRGASQVTEPAASAAGRDGAVMPQLSESFLDRLVDLTGQTRDLEFRQKLTNRTIDESVLVAEGDRQLQFYESVRKTTSSVVAPPADIRATLDAAYNQLARAVDLTEVLYRRISEQNLNPSTVLYSLNSPFIVRTTSALSGKTALFYLAATVLAAFLLVPLFCLAHAYSEYVIGTPDAATARPNPTLPTPKGTGGKTDPKNSV